MRLLYAIDTPNENVSEIQISTERLSISGNPFIGMDRDNNLVEAAPNPGRRKIVLVDGYCQYMGLNIGYFH